MRLRAQPLCILLAGISLALTTFSAAAAEAAPIRECGDLPGRLAYNITTRKVFCTKAKQVVRRWGKTVAVGPAADGQVFDLYCNYRNSGIESGDIRCTGPRGRVVRWQTGS